MDWAEWAEEEEEDCIGRSGRSGSHGCRGLQNDRTCGGDVLNARERKKGMGRDDRDDRPVLYDIGCVRLSPSHYT